MQQLTSIAGTASEDSQARTWSAFTSSTSDKVFFRSWIELQCEQIEDVQSALVLLRDDAGEGSYIPAALWPDESRDLSYLGEAAQRSLAAGRGLILGKSTEDAEFVSSGQVHMALPLEIDGVLAGVAVLDLRSRPDSELQAVMRRLLWGSGWLHATLRQRRVFSERQLLDRAAITLELLQVVQEHDRLTEAGMALVNEVATQFNADRVSLGLQRDDQLKLCAVSRTAWFDGKSELVQTIENAMEEAIDQQSCVIYPVPAESVGASIVVAHRDFAVASGAATLMTIPLSTNNGEPVGALTLERDAGTPFSASDLPVGQLIGELLGPEFAARGELERWVTGRLIHTLHDWRDRLLGPRWPGVKLGAAAAVLVLLFLAFAEGDFRVSARTLIEGQLQRATVAPFDGYVASASARAGDVVSKGQVLAELDDREIRLELARWQAEKEQASRKYREALAERDAASSRIYAAQQRQAEAQLALVRHKLERTQLVAPLDSVVVSGDLSQLLGAPVERGKVLFELAPLGAYRVILQVDDRDISYVSIGQQGELALAGLADITLPFTIKSVTSVSTPEEGRNFFRVEAEIDDSAGRLRPGMEGVGKISIAERKLVWIWTRNFVNWLRLKFWTWLP
jgi:biotin carboxyl carrier protein